MKSNKNKSKQTRMYGSAKDEALCEFLASTDGPEAIEASAKLEELRNKRLDLGALFEKFKVMALPGQKSMIEGEIVGKDAGGFYVAYGQKYDGYVPFDQASDLSLGDAAAFWVMSDDEGQAQVELSANKAKGWLELSAASESREPVEVEVFAVARARRSLKTVGLRVECRGGNKDGIRGFVPNSQAPDLVLDTLVGKRIQVVPLTVSPFQGNQFGELVLSARVAEQEQTCQYMKSLAVGAVLQGRVAKFIKVGNPGIDSSVLVDLGRGLIGFLHRSEIDGYPDLKAEQAMSIGDTINVAVSNIQPDIRKVSLSQRSAAVKATMNTLTKGEIVAARVLSRKSYGYFCSIGGLKGLLHVSDLKKAGGVLESFEPGETIQVRVISFLPDGSRLALGCKQVS